MTFIERSKFAALAGSRPFHSSNWMDLAFEAADNPLLRELDEVDMRASVRMRADLNDLALVSRFCEKRAFRFARKGPVIEQIGRGGNGLAPLEFRLLRFSHALPPSDANGSATSSSFRFMPTR